MKEGIGFKLTGLKTEQFATFEENYSEKGKTGLQTGIEFKFNKEEKVIGVLVTFMFAQKKKVFLKITVSCHFTIENESFKSFCKESKIIFPKGFIIHLTMITISSARGVLHAKTEGTVFNKFLLPTLDVTEIVKKDVEFSLTNEE